MKLLLDEKVAIVTGASSGIGRATAIAFAQAGAKVVVAARRIQEGEETVRLAKDAGNDALFVQTDVTKATDIENLVNKTLDTYGRLDFACNNAGSGKSVPLTQRSEEGWDMEIDVNLKSVWLCLKYQIPAMLKTGGGAIVNMASMGGAVVGVPGLSSYNAAKGGVLGLTRSAAMEFAGQGIRINAISPGLIATDILSNVEEEVLQKMIETIPLKRAGEAKEIASAVIWLCSEGASYITGQNIVIDGGFTVQ
ncbi:3-oxoacyl-(acyl-carrier-protein) reductase FabG [Hyella patelloides LEGE 07179]|uniref:3-oxoacyl-(Acyl-carrier-protein) reductase FabG n=1 Tax=Hyella patelloides LEGE 07179 TaxID=945734 RepID=A0A563W1S9_9CYAN|nr:glucose 1-dehydrogenase [Hyella patelloides]VEP17595.1 3-oxoacyl-(acyl-carrier-protein) reductase FabG [Hyella patelloides LEGE 07179]